MNVLCVTLASIIFLMLPTTKIFFIVVCEEYFSIALVAPRSVGLLVN